MIVDIYLTVRLKSSRLPKKALAEVGGQSIIEHIIDRARHIKKATNIILCTSVNPEDDALEEIAQKKGVECFRGSEDNIVERFIGASELNNPDIGVRITGDNCLFWPQFIDHAIEEHVSNGVDYTSTKELAGGSKGDIFSMDALRRLYKMLQDDHASEYLSWLLADDRYFNVQWLGVEQHVKRPNYRLHCDTYQDLDFVTAVYDQLYKAGTIVDYESAIKFLDEHPEIVAINSQIKQVSKDQVEQEINFNLKE